MLPLVLLFAAFVAPENAVHKAMEGRTGAFVLIDCASGEMFRSDDGACAEKEAPCSTFKIWNSAIGLETAIVKDPDAPFWKWDGQKRWLAAWNRDQTLRSAIAVSCVPAYQNLARAIGKERMQAWLDKIGYGNRDISAGIDAFWLPAPGRKTILITPLEQARMLARLVEGKLPFSPKTVATVKSIIQLKTTGRGVFYGKTGAGDIGAPGDSLAWFVGFVESSGKTYTFACMLKGKGVAGQDARAIAESVLTELRLL